MIDLGFLEHTVPTPVWALLTLAGYQRALKMLQGARSGAPSTKDRKESSGNDHREDTTRTS